MTHCRTAGNPGKLRSRAKAAADLHEDGNGLSRSNFVGVLCHPEGLARDDLRALSVLLSVKIRGCCCSPDRARIMQRDCTTPHGVHMTAPAPDPHPNPEPFPQPTPKPASPSACFTSICSRAKVNSITSRNSSSSAASFCRTENISDPQLPCSAIFRRRVAMLHH